MRAGQLREPLVLRQRSDTAAALGTLDSTFSNERRAWGRVELVAGLKLLDGQQVAEGATHRITVRRDTSINQATEITFDGETLRVLAVLQSERRTHTMIDCEQVSHRE